MGIHTFVMHCRICNPVKNLASSYSEGAMILTPALKVRSTNGFMEFPKKC